MKKYFLIVASVLALVVGMFTVRPVLAQSFLNDTFDQLDATGGKGGAEYSAPQDPRLIVSRIVKILLTLVGTVVFILMLYAGYQWMMAGGNDEQVTQAKATIRNTTLGLIVILSAYGLTILVTNLAVGRSAGSGTSRGSTLDGAVQSAGSSIWNKMFGK